MSGVARRRIDGRFRSPYPPRMTQTPTLYDRLGGAKNLQSFVAAFYAHMHSAPEARAVSAMHVRPHDEMAHRLFAFLSGMTGGPPLYHDAYGAPFMRARHLPFPIDTAAREAWIACAVAAAQKTLPDDPSRAEFLAHLAAFADHMRNRADGA